MLFRSALSFTEQKIELLCSELKQLEILEIENSKYDKGRHPWIGVNLAETSGLKANEIILAFEEYRRLRHLQAYLKMLRLSQMLPDAGVTATELYQASRRELEVGEDHQVADRLQAPAGLVGVRGLVDREAPGLQGLPQHGAERLFVLDDQDVGHARPRRGLLFVLRVVSPAIGVRQVGVGLHEVLAGVLDGGSAARLSRNLVRGRQIAARAGASYDLLSRYPTLFLLDGNPAPGYRVADLEAALLAEVEALKNRPVTAKELERVKAQVVASDVYGKDSVFYQAMKIGTYETVGLDWREVYRYVERVQAVSAAQVQAVARKFLVAENMTVAELKPQPMEPTKIRRPASAGRHGAR